MSRNLQTNNPHASQLTLEQINQQIAKLQEQAATIAGAEKAEVIGKMKVAIDHYGITAADLGISSSGKAKVRKANGRAKPKVKAAGRVKYRDDEGHSWTGVGRKPAWFVDALAGGKTEADLHV